MKNNVCLTMIVRDESRVIERCLKSVIPYIDSWAITDTGSEDDTMEIIQRALQDVPGKLYQEPWVNFGTNRTIAFKNAKKHGRYALIIDADDIFLADEGFSWPEMNRSHYEMNVELTGTSFAQARLLQTIQKWNWIGAVHEYPELDSRKADMPATVIEGASVLSMPDGNRRLSEDGGKYRQDAKLLEDELKKNPDDTRSLFYLAQSYRDCGDTEKAIEVYRKRTRVEGWDEEVWYSQYQIGVLYDTLADGESDPDIKARLRSEAVGAYLEAYRIRPQRIEPLVTLSRNLRMRDEHHLAHLFISSVAYAPKPADRLFIDSATYEWFALDEYAVCCYCLEMYEESLKANRRLLEVAPIVHITRIRENIRHNQEALSKRE